ncbi:hypothetical protein VTI74DRAFT_3265 [Chaetomium olivicolor]
MSDQGDTHSSFHPDAGSGEDFNTPGSHQEPPSSQAISLVAVSAPSSDNDTESAILAEFVTSLESGPATGQPYSAGPASGSSNQPSPQHSNTTSGLASISTLSPIHTVPTPSSVESFPSLSSSIAQLRSRSASPGTGEPVSHHEPGPQAQPNTAPSLAASAIEGRADFTTAAEAAAWASKAAAEDAAEAAARASTAAAKAASQAFKAAAEACKAVKATSEAAAQAATEGYHLEHADVTQSQDSHGRLAAEAAADVFTQAAEASEVAQGIAEAVLGENEPGDPDSQSQDSQGRSDISSQAVGDENDNLGDVDDGHSKDTTDHLAASSNKKTTHVRRRTTHVTGDRPALIRQRSSKHHRNRSGGTVSLSHSSAPPVEEEEHSSSHAATPSSGSSNSWLPLTYPPPAASMTPVYRAPVPSAGETPSSSTLPSPALPGSTPSGTDIVAARACTRTSPSPTRIYRDVLGPPEPAPSPPSEEVPSPESTDTDDDTYYYSPPASDDGAQANISQVNGANAAGSQANGECPGGWYFNGVIEDAYQPNPTDMHRERGRR